MFYNITPVAPNAAIEDKDFMHIYILCTTMFRKANVRKQSYNFKERFNVIILCLNIYILIRN